MASPIVRVDLLGTLQVVQEDGEVIEWFRTQKSALLLARLAYDPLRRWSREELSEWLWPEIDPETQRARLRYQLTTLRRVAGPDLIESVGNTYLTLSESVQSDVALFLQAIHEQRWEDAARGYSGDFMTGFYDDFVLAEREHLRKLAHDATLNALRAAQAAGHYEQAHYWHTHWQQKFPESDVVVTLEALSIELKPLPAPPTLPEPPTITVPRRWINPQKLRPVVIGLSLTTLLTVTCGLAYHPLVRALFPHDDFAADFSVTTPQFHHWSLGVLTTESRQFSLMNAKVDANLSLVPISWIYQESPPKHIGDINKNLAWYTMNHANARWSPGQASFHPSHHAGYPIPCIRWTAPTTGTYRVAAHFSGISTWLYNGTTANVQLLLNDQRLWAAPLHGSAVTRVSHSPHPTATYRQPLALKRGDTLDFTVDDAQDWDCDQVGVELTVTPEAVYQREQRTRQILLSGGALSALLACALGFFHHQRKKSPR